MAYFKLTPRLNFDFSFFDLMTAFKGVFGRDKSKSESKLSEYFPDSDLHFTNHARTGLLLLLKALDLPKNAKVGVVVYNCLTVFEAIELAGYQPVFIDTDSKFRLCKDDFLKKEKKLDAMVVTHLFGVPSDIRTIVAQMGVRPVIEDCAHSFLNKSNEKFLGTFGVGAVFSFGHAKFPAAAEGGVVIINDKKLNSRYLKEEGNLENYSSVSSLISIVKAYVFAILMNKYIYGSITVHFKKRFGDKLDVNKKYVFNEKYCNPGFKNVFEKRMNRIDELIDKQHSNARQISDCIQERFPENTVNESGATFMVPFETNEPEVLMTLSTNRGIELGRHFQNSLLWANKFSSFDGVFPNAAKLISKTVTIPCHYNLTKSEIKEILNLINSLDRVRD